MLRGLAGMFLVLVLLGLVGEACSKDPAAVEQELRHREQVHEVEIDALRQKRQMEIMRERQLQPVKTAAKGIIMMGGTFVVLGAGFYLVQILRKRANLVHADDKGLFPLVRVQISGAEAIHDPNRAPWASTVYQSKERSRVEVKAVVVPGLEGAAEAAVRQAQAIQLTRAAVSGQGLVEDAQRTARRFFPEEGTSRLPMVRVLESVSPGIEQLVEDSEDAGS